MILSNLRASAWKYAALGCAVLAVAGLIAALFFRGAEATSRLRAVAAEQRAQALAGELANTQAALKAEREQVVRQAAIAAQYEQDKHDAEVAQARLVADLRAGNVQLRQRWQGCEARVPGPAASAGEPDAVAADRAESAGRIVRAAAECDAQVKGLQEVIKADRK